MTQNRLKRAMKGGNLARKHFQQGSLFKRGKSRPVWVGRWWEEVMTAAGRLVRVRRSEVLGSVRDMPQRRDALRAFSNRLHVVNGRNYPVKRKMGFTDFVKQDWSPVTLPTLKYATQKSYDYLLRVHLLPAFGDLALCEISREKIQLFLNAKLAQGLAWETVHHLQCALSKIVSAAVEWGYLEANPVRLTKLPRRRRAAAKAVLTGEQILRLLMILREPVRSLVFLLTVTGLRVGEALALRWRNVDLANAILRIEETVYDGHFDDPKSKRSRRVVPLGPRLLALLARRRAQTISGPDDLVFATAKGTPLDRHTMLSRHLKPAANALGLADVTWHALRHANATLHDSLGTPLGTVQALLGHSSSEITRQVYMHAVPEDQQRAAKRLEDALFGPKSDPIGEPKQLPVPQVIEEIGRGGQI